MSRLRSRVGALPLAVLGASLLLAVFVWKLYDGSLKARSQSIYDDETREITARIVRRMHDHEQVLRGAVGLFKVNEGVTRADWRRYVTALELDEHHPGILGVGFARWMTPAERDANVAATRAEGFPEYVVRPEGDRPAYTSIVFLEPFDWRNQRAFGYDMYSEPRRRAAMDKARDQNITAIAAKIVLLQETDKDKQAGMLMYVPVYRQGTPTDTVELRRRALLGFVYSPIRMNDFVRATLEEASHDIAFELSVDGAGDADPVMFSTVQADALRLPDAYRPTFTSASVVESYGCAWRFTFKSLPSFDNELRKTQSYLFLGGSLLVAVLVSCVAWLALKTRRQAMARAEEQLQHLNSRLSLAAGAARIGVWDLMIRERRISWDPRMYALYGLPEDASITANAAWEAGVHPDDMPRVEAALAAALRGSKDFDVEFRVVWPSGEERDLKACAIVLRGRDGQPSQMVGVNYDITERRRAVEELKRREDTISQLLQTTDQGIYGIDVTGRCTFINKSGLQILGYELEECLGKNMHDLVHHSHADGAPYAVEDCPIFRSKATGLGCRLDTEVMWRKDGTPFASEYSSYSIVAGGVISGAVITFSDITARKAIEEELRRSRDAADAANVAKSEFLATMSHEIRTPMNGVIGMTDLLLRTSLTAVQQEYAEIVRKSGNNLLSLINDILDFSKIEARKLDMENVDFDLRMAVEDTASMLGARARDAKLGLRCAIAADVPSHLKGDGGRLRQIITNLAGNAIKFTQQGEIAIRASLASAHDGFATIRFEISDTGIGIPEARRAAIFDPFTQADGSTTRKYGGTGLGLAICKQLVGLMGGEIGVTSEEGVGSTFWFTARFEELAADVAPQEPPSPKRAVDELPGTAADTPAPRARAARILLAEDNPINQMVAAAMLEQLGYQADVVGNGHEVIAALETADYDLVLMDCQMPELDGIEATTIIRDPRSKVRDHGVPIVAMTANAMKGDREACLDAGMTDYIAKPIRTDELAKVLERLEKASATRLRYARVKAG